MSTVRAEGQLWIDKNSPYKLKYHVNGQDYIVETSATYPVNPNTKTPEDRVYLHAGEVVALDDNGYIKPAEFPKDIRRVLGVSLSDVEEHNKDLGVGILQTGYLDLEHPEKLFKDSSIENTTKTTVGAPVYWDTYNPGKLTLKLPNGFYPSDPPSDLTIHYGNLPQVGTLAETYIYNETDNSNNHLYIHVNMMSFETTIDWYAEKELDHASEGTLESTDLTFAHGLLKNDTDMCHVDVTSIHKIEQEDVGSTQGTEQDKQIILQEHPAFTYVSHNYIGNPSSTTVKVSSPESVTFKINGRVSYSATVAKSNIV